MAMTMKASKSKTMTNKAGNMYKTKSPAMGQNMGRVGFQLPIGTQNKQPMPVKKMGGAKARSTAKGSMPAAPNGSY